MAPRRQSSRPRPSAGGSSPSRPRRSWTKSAPGRRSRLAATSRRRAAIPSCCSQEGVAEKVGPRIKRSARAKSLLQERIYLTVLFVDRYAVPGTGEDPQRDGDTARPKFLGKRFCLPHWNSLVLRAVEQKDGCSDLLRMIDRGTGPERLGRGAGLEPDVGIDPREWGRIPAEEVVRSSTEHDRR